MIDNHTPLATFVAREPEEKKMTELHPEMKKMAKRIKRMSKMMKPKKVLLSEFEKVIAANQEQGKMIESLRQELEATHSLMKDARAKAASKPTPIGA